MILKCTSRFAFRARNANHSPFRLLMDDTNHRMSNMSDMCTPNEEATSKSSTTDMSNGNACVRRRVAVDYGDDEIRKIVIGIDSLAKHVHPNVPNPAPLGLIAFGFTTCLLQMKHSRLTGSEPDEMAGVSTIMVGFAMFFGGLLQVSTTRSETICGVPHQRVYLLIAIIFLHLVSDHRWHIRDPPQ
jgi:GPR1/FUN34/yaaH family